MPPALMLITAGTACLPPLVFLIFRRWLGRHDLESLPLLLLCFAFGATLGTVFGALGARVLEKVLIAWSATPLTDSLIEAPLAEEVAKGMVLLLLCLGGRIPHSACGLFYGAATGLGFAMTENLLYFTAAYEQSGPDAWYINLVTRTLFSTVMHMTASATLGFLLGLGMSSRHAGRVPRTLLCLFGFFCAFAIHGLWNVTLYIGQAISDALVSVHLFLTVPFVAVVLMLLTEVALRSEGRILREELAEEVRRGLIPQGHEEILASHRRRRGKAWLPAGVPRDAYVRALCRLALAKHRQKQGGGLLDRERERIRSLTGRFQGRTPD